jgi:hypothetical protein
MTTSAQKRANKQNAQHSTGPRTEQGKKRTSLNALKHGFRARDPLIPGENPDHYYRHSAEIEHELQPATPLEETLVEQIVDITWRLKRFARIEAAVVNELYDNAAEQPENQDKDGEQLLGKALADSHALNRLSRYEAQLSRRYQSTMKELRELRRRRRASAFLNGLGVGRKVAAVEPTHSTTTPIESGTPGDSPTSTSDREHHPVHTDNSKIHQPTPQDPAGTANQEAAA